MRKKSIFSLDPDQLERLFSVGTGDQDPKAEQKPQTNPDKVGKGREDIAREKYHPPREKGLSVNATASFVGMEEPGSQIGRYKILRVLGEGGMGMVYLAEQEGQLRRKVALKIIKPGMDSKRVIARFETERQALALLDHPGIAQVYDAGMTETGRPYFVMEHVRGLPMTDYCDRHKLTVEERLRLFQQVCLAVHHAHQKGIIHRDVKPSNILVSAENDRPIPKIIDFGVAKAISQPLTERTLFTEESHLLGTPEYMSPEQADMSSEDIDTRSDIYSLGVLLYVLLAGILPYDSKTFRQGGVEHIRRIIQETDPKTPSTRLTKLGEEATKLAENRRTEIHTLARNLKKELEWIPLKAMRKERSERYRSASELADDIENYLKGAPLMAGPLTSGYRLRKFLRRHKSLVGGVAAVLLVSVVGAIVSVTFAVGQANALAKQARALEQNKALANFLEYRILKPFAENSFKPVGIREVFDSAEEKLVTWFADYPLLEARIRFIFGDIYTFQFSDYDKAIANLERAVELEESERGWASVYYRNWLALAYKRAGRYQEAESLFRQMVESIEEERGIRPSAMYCALKHHLANTYMVMGRYDEAERHLRECPFPQAWEEGDWREFNYKKHLPHLLTLRGRYDEARKLYDALIQRSRSVQDKEIGAIMTVKKNLGILHMLQDNLVEATLLLEEALEGARKAWGEEQWRTEDFRIALAVLRTKQDRYEEAESLFDECLEDMQKKMQGDHPELLRVKSQLGVLYREQGRHDEAENLLTQVSQRQAQSKEIGPDHPHTLESMHELAVLHLRLTRYEDAEPLLLEAYHGRTIKLGPDHPHTVESLRELVNLYESWNKPDEAAKWRAKLLRLANASE